MAHPIIEHAARTLPETGYTVEPVRASTDQPAQLLIQLASPQEIEGRERWALLTVFEDLGATLVDAHLVQLFIGFNTPAGEPAKRADLARLLVAANNKIATGQFAFREEDGLLYYRAVLMLPKASEEWTSLIDEHLIFATYQLDEFGPAIEAVAGGTQTLAEAIEGDPRLGPLA
ncbi:MAG: hypothetical protein WCI61_10175 [Chloroflexota bacterium]